MPPPRVGLPPPDEEDDPPPDEELLPELPLELDGGGEL